ncbi:hypothetical protein [Umezawaea sp. Da 62-37]|uniref:hypothetical protein n=1 Tax=Umezawaea sp. Da 62-37 TaxID=3075927 RepID=UPI0028F6E10F|nr:hypothetical protein [Umezawaea sp. Da 62-37]WNV90561.1 hypothetical protein RM788_20445 [Umezawaea sp. Da 62-37]
MAIQTQVPAAARLAGALTAAQGLAGIAFAVALVFRAFGGAESTGKVLGEAGYFTVLCAGVLAAGVGLVLGKRWARTPSIVVQLLLLGVAWYMYGPSGQQLVGSLIGLYSVVVVVLLFTAPVREWTLGLDEPDAEE